MTIALTTLAGSLVFMGTQHLLARRTARLLAEREELERRRRLLRSQVRSHLALRTAAQMTPAQHFANFALWEHEMRADA